MKFEAIIINSFMHYNRNLSKSSKFLIKKVVNNSQLIIVNKNFGIILKIIISKRKNILI